MFEDWHDFYLLVGGAAGALIGLLFVVASLTGGMGRQNATRGASLYLTPTLFHFGVVLAVAALAMAPGVTHRAAAWIVGGCASAGLAYAVVAAVGIQFGETSDPPHWSDVWCYGVGPAVCYLGVAASGVALAEASPAAPFDLAIALTVLMFVSIRNAWDLITWIAPRVNAKEDGL
ncbi:MAG: hypothetical protein P4L73_08480 [Caulobacteraceae bacterium]|nr:hypothetical protein [Caulobacteraceae bacterium]